MNKIDKITDIKKINITNDIKILKEIIIEPGEKGDPGEKGEQGEQGDKGVKGDIGESGSEIGNTYFSSNYIQIISEALFILTINPIILKVKGYGYVNKQDKFWQLLTPTQKIKTNTYFINENISKYYKFKILYEFKHYVLIELYNKPIN